MSRDSKDRGALRQSLRLGRMKAMAIRCPKCAASPCDPCMGSRLTGRVRVSPHIERYEAAARIMRAMKGRRDA